MSTLQQLKTGRQLASVPEEPLVSLVMPCLNEAATVGRCVQEAREWLASQGVAGEVVVCDNGSSDASRDIASLHGARVVIEEAKGYGHASWTAITSARGRYIVTADADATYDFREADRLIERLVEGNDIVLGNRLEGDLADGAMPWLHRFIGTPLLSWLLRRLSGTTVRDSQSGYRAMTKEARDQLDLVSGGMEFASEMILKAERKGLRISEVPITYRHREGESKLRTLRDGWRHLRLLLLLAPGVTFLLVSAGFITAGVALQVTSAIATSELEWRPVFLGTILMVVGLNAFVIGGIARMHAVKRGLIKPDWLVRLFQTEGGLEAMGGLAILLFLAGGGLEVALATTALGGSGEIWQSSLAQGLILLGANLGMVTLVVGLFETEQ